ncbi:PREDICTED: ADP-ribose pyrophosphatase, mitochondrial-like isoform X2 [Priapulus caudatus]|uniref:ADP-ribose pyrophosphatase, mitochondrial-like isoform X2 n=1 Tax=Priapulus caudatus TaxID=37621 RepID=A0ABM1EAD9_PRICU|nr:PREDICTED: ADP-ribose pyrophosphatase, mitochondrial-like isoform X2 [Priapulus caudatus]
MRSSSLSRFRLHVIYHYIIFIVTGLYWQPAHVVSACDICKVSERAGGTRYMGGIVSQGVHNTCKTAKGVIESATVMRKLHKNCRVGQYPHSHASRFSVPDDKVGWDVSFPEYSPAEYTAESVLARPSWADPDISDGGFHPAWNALDKACNVNRRSHFSEYTIVNDRPRNPVGRTGIVGRGCLGKWGPNHAADPIVTRWKRGAGGEIQVDKDTNSPILQFVSVQRGDTLEWAIPGGMVDPGELISTTLIREFGEEALNTLELNQSEAQGVKEAMEKLFAGGVEVYRGYVDDPRNTDNSWMETVAVNFHDESGNSLGKFALHAGDDAIGVRWTDISRTLCLFASHADFVEKVAGNHCAHW